jgi:DNA-binding transcriptional LysR family regulator
MPDTAMKTSLSMSEQYSSDPSRNGSSDESEPDAVTSLEEDSRPQRVSRFVGKPEGSDRPHLDLRLLSQFLVICECDNMTGAARQMGLSTPAVSQIIQRIERELGVTVFARNSRGIRLTPAGFILRDEARALLVREDEILETLAPYRAHWVPRLSIHVVGSVASYIMPAVVAELKSATGELELRSGRSHALVQAFIRGEIDILISSETMDDLPGIERHRVCREEIIALAPAGLPKDKLNLRALAETLPLIRFAHGGSMDGLVESYLASQGVSAPRTIECSSQAPILELIAQGMGWTITTPLSAAYFRPLSAGTVIVPLPKPLVARDIHVVANAGRLLDIPSSLAQACRTALREQVATWRGTGNDMLLPIVQVEGKTLATGTHGR